jgi:hypothetical protein
MRKHFKEGYESYKRIEFYRIEKRRKESRNNEISFSRTVF